MGLDWVLAPKIIEGKEAEHEDVRQRRIAARDLFYAQKADTTDAQTLIEMERTLRRLEEEEHALEVSPYVVLGCPRIGVDPEATEHAKAQYLEHQGVEFQRDFPTLDAWILASHGKYVPELAKHQDGLGRITGILAGPESFRGKVIGYAGPLIGDALAERAYQDMNPDEMRAYADEIEEKVNAWEAENQGDITYYTAQGPTGETQFQIDRRHGTALSREVSDRRFEVQDLLAHAEDCRDAVTWLRFWARNGFSLVAWS